MSDPRHIVVLGGTGFIGQRLVRRLADDGHRVEVLSRHRESRRAVAMTERVLVRNVDVHDDAALRAALTGADMAINLVGILHPRGAQTFRRVHVELTRRLIDACRAAGIGRLHQMSAIKAGQGLSEYLRTRGEADALVRQSSLAWTIYQPSVVFGPGDGLVTRFAALLRRLPVLPLPRAQARLAPTWVGDVVEAIARSIGPLDITTHGRTLELCGPQVLTLGQIVRAIRDAMRARCRILPMPDSLGRVQAQVAGLLPGAPLSLDQFRTLRTDAVGKTDGYAVLGIAPASFDARLPELLTPSASSRRLAQARRKPRH